MFQISLHYRSVFSFRVFHEYYSEETLSDFQMIPTERSANKARRLGLIIKQNKNKLSVLFEEYKTELLSGVPLEELKFSFFIYSKNPYFYHFTELPVEPPTDKILYFSNRFHEREFPSGPLSRGAFAEEQDYRELSEIQEPFPPEYPIKKPIAFVEIFIPSTLRKEIEDAIPFSQLVEKEYSIRFPARKTYWKYAFVSSHRKLEAQAEIQCGNGLPASFVRRGQEILLNKQEAIIFISTEPLALKQRSEYDLKLTQKDKVNKITEILPRLPIPSVERIQPESRAAGAKVYSEVVVYI